MEILLSGVAGMFIGWLASSGFCSMRSSNNIHETEHALSS